MSATSATSWAEIDLAALRRNVQLLQQVAAPAGVAAVVKADAYGHGAIAIARAAVECGAVPVCVFTVREAVELRAAGLDDPILCLGPVLGDDPAAIATHDIAAVVDSANMAQRLANAARAAGAQVRVHINLDSGMQRHGRPLAEGVALARRIREHDSLQLEGVFTHFPDATNPDQSRSTRALDAFQRVADQIGAGLRHAAASAAAFHLPGSSFDFIRAGIALYGIDPAPETPSPHVAQLQPVLSWRTSLLAVRDVAAGASVSYGGLWTAKQDSRIGVLGVGYADGLRRALSPGGEVLVRGERAPIRGAICMDSAMIDLTGIEGAAVGDVVTIIGRDGHRMISAWDLARQLDTIPYEIFTSIGPRVPRIVVGESG